jgi:hypothetical protein
MDWPRSPCEQRHVALLSIVAGCPLVRLEADGPAPSKDTRSRRAGRRGAPALMLIRGGSATDLPKRISAL